MKKLLALSVLTAGLGSVSAADLFYVATLDTAQEAHQGGTGRTGSGSGSFTLDDSTSLFSYSVSYSGLSANSTAAHIHGPALPGVDAGVIFGLSGTLGATSGSFSGSTTITPTQIQQLNDGLWYVNIHSSAFPGGEIRGQVVVPEPGTVALMAAAGGLLIAFRRKRS